MKNLGSRKKMGINSSHLKNSIDQRLHGQDWNLEEYSYIKEGKTMYK